MRVLTGILLLSSLGLASEVERLNDAATVMSEIMGTPDKGVPQDLLDKAHCVVVVPALKKGAFIVGATYGKGFLTCRKAGGGWSAPAAMRVEGGSVGFQIGGEETDVVMLVMNKNALPKLLESKFTLGAEGSVAGGPVGRTATAQTDAQMRAEILSWSRSRGAFAGLALTGATLRPDKDDNKELYGREMTAGEIIKTAKPPAAANNLLSLLNRYSPREKT